MNKVRNILDHLFLFFFGGGKEIHSLPIGNTQIHFLFLFLPFTKTSTAPSLISLTNLFLLKLILVFYIFFWESILFNSALLFLFKWVPQESQLKQKVWCGKPPLYIPLRYPQTNAFFFFFFRIAGGQYLSTETHSDTKLQLKRRYIRVTH